MQAIGLQMEKQLTYYSSDKFWPGLINANQ